VCLGILLFPIVVPFSFLLVKLPTVMCSWYLEQPFSRPILGKRPYGDGKQYMQTRIDEEHYALVQARQSSAGRVFEQTLCHIQRVGSRHCYFLQQNPPTWINGAILEIMTISKRQSVVSAGSHEHKIDLSCRGRRSDMDFLCLNRLGLVDPRTYNVGVVCRLVICIYVFV
jgi:hypothetical protein